jgi:uncharacterized protein (DUF2141 family)
MAHLPGTFVRTAALALALAGAGSAQALDLTVEVVNPKAQQGAIMAAVYAGADGWLQGNKAAAAQRVPVAETTVLVFRNLRPGLHGISLFHDENGNGVMDTTVIGLPIERYGFSRDARASMGPPGFADAAIDLQADTTIRITLK